MSSFLIYDSSTGLITKAIQCFVGDTSTPEGSKAISAVIDANVEGSLRAIPVPDNDATILQQGTWKIEAGVLSQKTIVSLLVSSVAGVVTVTLSPKAPGAIVIIQPGSLVPILSADGLELSVKLPTGVRGVAYISPIDTVYASGIVDFST